MPPHATSPAAEFGAILKREREMREASLDDIAKATRVSRSMLLALEEGRLDALPQGVFVRGFIRAYAESIGADPAGMVNRYVELCETSREETRRVEEAKRTLREANTVERRGAGALFGAAVVLALIGVVLAVAFIARAAPKPPAVGEAPATLSRETVFTVRAPTRRETSVAPDSEISFEATETVRVSVEWNEETVLRREMAPGEARSYPLHAPLALSADPGRAIRLRLDGKPLPAVEGSGALTLRAAHGRMEYGFDSADSPGINDPTGRATDGH